jgi:two-component system cell cycle response regulator
MIPVTLSIGIAALRGEADNAASLLKRADQALYRAKRDGRNRVVPDAA